MAETRIQSLFDSAIWGVSDQFVGKTKKRKEKKRKGSSHYCFWVTMAHSLFHSLHGFRTVHYGAHDNEKRKEFE